MQPTSLTAQSASSATTTSVMFACVTASWPRTSPRRSAAVLWGQPGVTTVRLTPAPSQAQVGLWPHHARQSQCSACQLHLDALMNCFFSFLLLAPVFWSVEYQEICPLGKGYVPQEDLLSGKVSFTGTSTILCHFFQGGRGRALCKTLYENALTKLSPQACCGGC